MASRLVLAFALALAAAACGKPAATTSDASAPASPGPLAASGATSAAAANPSTPAAATQAPSTPPPPLEHPLDVGSQAAKDDLYCSGMLFSKYASTGEAMSPTDEAVRMRGEQMAVAIAQAGADKLMAEGAARVTQIGAVSDAYADKAAGDIKAGKPRLKMEACVKRAEALPMPQP